jgi:hypothetical protein
MVRKSLTVMATRFLTVSTVSSLNRFPDELPMLGRGLWRCNRDFR